MSTFAARVRSFVRGEESGGWSLAWAERMHRRERGSMSVFFLLISIVFYATTAKVWNTGTVLSGKIHAQNAADAAAYTAAMWNSRAMNMVTSANMLILRNASAQVNAQAAVTMMSVVPGNWAQAQAACGGSGPCLAAVNAQIAQESPHFAQFVQRHGIPAAEALADQRFLRNIDELHRFQREWIEQVPATIEAERAKLEAYYGVQIRLTRPGDADGRCRPPLVLGSATSLGPQLLLRAMATDNRLPTLGRFNMFTARGRAMMMWPGLLAQAVVGVSATVGDRHYVLTTQNGPAEAGPSTPAQRAPFTSFATVINYASGSQRHVAPGIFDVGINPIDSCMAYAQAETYNGVDERLRSFAITAPWAFRVWTTWGWQWQPRLTQGDQIRPVVQFDPVAQQMYRDIGVTAADEARLRFLALH